MPTRTRTACLLLLTVVACLGFGATAAAQVAVQAAPHVTPRLTPQVAPRTDWLVDGSGFPARVEEGAVPGAARGSAGAAMANEVTLDNGLLRRVIRLAPDAATVALDNLMTGQAELRSVRPEAAVTLDGQAYDIGGLAGQPIQNYLLPEWLDALTADPRAFHCVAHRTGRTRERFAWKPRTEWLSAPPSQAPAWPPPGVSLELDFAAPAGPAEGVTVTVHYELYDGLPLLAKWLTVRNGRASAVRLDTFTAEILAAVEPASLVEGGAGTFAAYPRSLHVETDFSFGGPADTGLDAPAVAWVADPLYDTQVNYERRTPCLLQCAPPHGVGVSLAPGGSLDSFRVFELLHDSTERERRGLAQRRMYRTLAPWVAENPLIFHVRSADPASVRAAVDQAAAVGFELVLMTFGSGFDIERDDPAYLAELKALAEYAHGKGIALGGYSLLASRSIDAADDVVNPATGAPGGFARFGNSPCLGSAWGQAYFHKLYAAFASTGLDVLEHDGSYPGDVCASVTHPGHEGLADSQWMQWRTITDFYAWCRGRGIYLNVPDWYYLNGANKDGMGYRETNWSLPREQQELIERQNVYDGTWTRTPSMGWMFVPLTEYQGGGAAATIEPLSEHLQHYERRLGDLLGAGVQACWRGPRLYDGDATEALVRRMVGWFKAHRAILESDILHGRRADGRDLDWIVHVNPALPERAMLVAWNPADTAVTRRVPVSLAPAGLAGAVHVSLGDAPPATVELGPDGRGEIELAVPARGMAWAVFRP